MDLGQLQTFVAAAEHLSFTRAARRRHLSQPAVSAQIRLLEEHLGVALFERRGTRLALTPAGNRLRALALDVLRAASSIEDALAEFRAAPQGIIRLACSTSVGIYLIPKLLAAFAEESPQTRVTVSLVRGLVVDELRDARVRFGIVSEPTRVPAGWSGELLFEDELIATVAPGMPLAAKRRVTATELASQTFVMREAASPTRRLLSEKLAELGLDPRALSIRYELGNTEGLKQLVLAGLGVGFVSRHSVTRELDEGRLVEVAVRGLKIHRPVTFLYPGGGGIDAHERAFRDLVQSRRWLPPRTRSAPLSNVSDKKH